MVNFKKVANVELRKMSACERANYFMAYKEYVLSLPFDENEMLRGENCYLKTANKIMLRYHKEYEPLTIKRGYRELPNPFILVSNHLDTGDENLHISAFPKIPFHYMIASSLFTPENRKMGEYYLENGAFVIDKDNLFERRKAEDMALQYLFRGKYIALFPEGTRTLRYGGDGTVQKFHKGAVSIAQASNVPIIPVAINNNLVKGGISINIGDTFKVSYDDNIFEKTNELRDEVIKLWEDNKKRGAKIILA
jgi:1-acyl-sn-glycerol-3-phosphate acyltransferase